MGMGNVGQVGFRSRGGQRGLGGVGVGVQQAPRGIGGGNPPSRGGGGSAPRLQQPGSGGGTAGYGTPGPTPTGSARPENNAQDLADYGSDLMDPNSELSKRFSQRMRGDVGKMADARQRSAGYQAAQAGFGTGGGQELLQMQQNIGVEGVEQGGQAAADFLTRAPGMGIDAMTRGLTNQVGMRGQDLQSRVAEQANILAREQSNSGLEMQQRNLDLQYDQMAQDAYMRELAMRYGGY